MKAIRIYFIPLSFLLVLAFSACERTSVEGPSIEEIRIDSIIQAKTDSMSNAIDERAIRVRAVSDSLSKL